MMQVRDAMCKETRIQEYFFDTRTLSTKMCLMSFSGRQGGFVSGMV